MAHGSSMDLHESVAPADFVADTAVEGSDGRFTAQVAEAWSVWSANGGYLAAIALRAALEGQTRLRAASLQAAFFAPVRAGTVDLDVALRKRGRTGEARTVDMRQDDKDAFRALVWATKPGDALEHGPGPLPVPGPERCSPGRPVRGRGPVPPLLHQLEFRPAVSGDPEVPSPADGSGGVERDRELWAWVRLRGGQDELSPLLDAARQLLVADALMWPAAMRRHTDATAYLAPSLDLHVSFHDTSSEPWVLLRAWSPVATAGLVAGRAEIRSTDGRLLASASQQMLCRPVRRRTSEGETSTNATERSEHAPR